MSILVCKIHQMGPKKLQSYFIRSSLGKMSRIRRENAFNKAIERDCILPLTIPEVCKVLLMFYKKLTVQVGVPQKPH